MTDDICRICEGRFPCRNIFDLENKHILKKLLACADIELSAEDDLPKHICEQCEDNLEFAYGFKIQCEYTDRKLRQALQQENDDSSKQFIIEEESTQEEEYLFDEEYNSIELIEVNTEEDINGELDECISQISNTGTSELINEYTVDSSSETIEYSVKVEHEFDIDHEQDTGHEQDNDTGPSSDYESKFDSDHNKKPDPDPDPDLGLDSEHIVESGEVKEYDTNSNVDSLEECNQSAVEDMLSDVKYENLEPSAETGRKSVFGKDFQCDTCNKTFTRYIDFNEHKRSHGDMRYQCQTCLKWFSKRYRLKNHMKIHEEEREFPCSQCDKKYTNPGNLDRHIRHFHKNERPYMCNECGLTFSRSNILKQHHAVHMNERNIPCDICDKKFKTQYYLSIHKKSHIPLELRKVRARDTSKTKSNVQVKQCTCPYCGKISNNVVLHKNHMRTHTGEKPYQCNTCGKKFAFQQSLRTHTMLHTGEKPYKCDVCDQSFRQIGHLKGHKLIHTGVKQHKCNFCQKTFALRSNLTVHERLHTGEMPYECLICDKKFYDTSGLRRHRMSHFKNASQEQVVQDENIEAMSVYLDEDGTEYAEIIEMQPESGTKMSGENYVVCEFVTTSQTLHSK